jgi:hypothetical protein
VTGAGLGLLATAGLAVFGYAQFENRQIVTLPVPTGDAQVGRVIYD